MNTSSPLTATKVLAVALASVALLVVPSSLRAQAAAPDVAAPPTSTLYQDPHQPVEARVADVLKQLTLEEKISMVHGKDNWTSGGIPRLGLPALWMDDGPIAVRSGFLQSMPGATDDAATALPNNLGLAATWNPALAFQYGSVIGAEAFRRGKPIMLGPSLNIQRTPLNGRNFEYLGEDPWLTSRMAVGYIKGQAAEGITGTAKHFAANNQETQRNTVDARVDERTLREIYFPAFKAAVQEGGVLSVMGSYNLLNGVHACENDYLLNQVLKGDWGFKGLVVSDWGGVHDTKEAVFNGMDIEMQGRGPDGAQNYLATAYLTGLKDGTYPMATLDDKVSRILYVMTKLGLLDKTSSRPPVVPPTEAHPLSTPEHQAIARHIEEEAIVLLKNSAGLLPLDAAKYKTIAVIGDNASVKFALGGGSATVKTPFEITPLVGIKERVGSAVTVNYARGYAAPAGGGRRGGAQPPAAGADVATLAADAVAAAKSADLVIYVGGLVHDRFDAEGVDRPDMKLPFGQDALLAQVLAANPKTVVVLLGGGAVEMPWIEQASTLVYGWYPGMEGGHAIASVLFGDVNPSGKLPCTFPKLLADTPAAAGGPEAYPGLPNPARPAAAPGAPGQRGGGRGGNPLIPVSIETYSEKLLVGYRWYDTKKIEPLFPFGFGLSYTKFEYSNLRLVSGGADGAVIVQFDVTNTGGREGGEVAQVYVHQDHPALERPEKELKGFAKVDLKPGERQTLTVPLNPTSFAYYDPAKSGWVAEAGSFQIVVGASSRDLRLHGAYSLAQTSILPK